MPPPASFIPISAVPFTQLVTQAMFNVANVQWFKYTPTSPIVLGVQVTQGGTFIPRIRIYEADGSTLFAGAFARDDGQWVALTPAADYYLQIEKYPLGGAPSDFDFTVTADTRPLDVFTLTAGDLLVNDDAGGFPAALLDSTGGVKAFVSAIPGGEMGAMLPSNVSYWHDFYGGYSATNKVAVFDANLAWVASVLVGPTAPNPAYFAVDLANNRVYVKHQAGELWTISAAGVAAWTGYTFVSPDVPQALAVNPTGTILYWVNESTDGVIHALNLSTFTALPSVYTVPGWAAGADAFARTPNFHPGDLFVLPNGNIVTWWVQAATHAYKLLVVSAAGALLYTYTYTSPISIDHLAYIHGDADHVLIWFFTDTGLSLGHFGRLTLATGVVDQDFTTPLFSEGENLAAPGPERVVMFGPSASCTFVRIQTTGGGGGGGPDPEPPEAYHLDTHPIRRLRRAPHVANEDRRVFYRTFELDLERGQALATGQGSAPYVLLRVSRDGGETWGEEVRMAAGALGDYTSRVLARRLGHARDTVFEVTVSDPIAWSLVGAWLELEAGTS